MEEKNNECEALLWVQLLRSKEQERCQLLLEWSERKNGSVWGFYENRFSGMRRGVFIIENAISLEAC